MSRAVHVRVETPGPQVTEDDVVAFETSLGRALPSDYRRFLLQYNGGVVVPDCFPIEGMPNNPLGRIQRLFGLNTAEEHNDLAWNEEIYRDRLPNHLLPIGNTETDDIVALSIDGETAGAVYLWDAQGEAVKETPWLPSDASNVYSVTPSFDGFIAALRAC